MEEYLLIKSVGYANAANIIIVVWFFMWVVEKVIRLGLWIMKEIEKKWNC